MDTMETTHLHCSECNDTFEVSTAVADAMHTWRERTGDPFLCVDCATHIAWGEAIAEMDGSQSPSDEREREHV